jgi:hypothetical protein
LYSTANISSLQAPLVTQPATPAPLPYHRATAAFSPGQRIAMLAVVLALSVPLTAIVLVFTDSNLVALGGVWLGIILITAIITGLGDKKTS